MSNTTPRPTFGSAIVYSDPAAALAWLEQAFGFTTMMRITDANGTLVHSEMRYGEGYLMVAGAWNEQTRPPGAVGGVNTQSVHVAIEEDIDAHCGRARAAGAVIVQEPEDQFYGDRVYRALDPEGHTWTFSQHLRDVTREEAEAATGLTIVGWT